MTLSTNDSANDTQHSNAFDIMLSKMTLNVTFYLFNAECHYAECRYAVSLYAECCYAECGALSYPMALLAKGNTLDIYARKCKRQIKNKCQVQEQAYQGKPWTNSTCQDETGAKLSTLEEAAYMTCTYHALPSSTA